MIRLRRIAQWLRTIFLRTSGDQPPAGPTPGSESPGLTIIAPAAVIYLASNANGPLRQGEILTDVIQHRRSFRSLGSANPEIEEIRHPYSVVVTQDCDLEQDYSARTSTTNRKDKLIPDVLLAQAVTAEELIASLPKGRDILRRVVQNKDERYHVLEKVGGTEDVQGQGLPALGVDFKRYFTIPTDELYAQLGSGAKRRTQLNSPYLEDFSKRLTNFLSRVALPKDHQIE